tara:strand:+ start:4239 stop:5171 length:933 start_codon:yes stop_codon:yes gene_type:complete
MADDSQELIWHGQQEDILKDWAEMAASYRWLHSRSYNEFKKQNMYFALPVIVISTITGTANFAQSSFPPSVQPYAPALIGFFNLTAGLITTIAQFLRVSEQMEGHRASSVEYGKLARNIEVELSLPAHERSSSGLEYIKKCRTEIDRLIEQSPDIPMAIIKSFQGTVMDELKDVQFGFPKVLKLEPINVFRHEDTKALIKKKEQERQAIFEMEKKKRDDILNEESKRRNSVIQDLNIDSQLAELEKLKKEKLDKEEKKKNLSISAISKTLGKLNSIMVGDDSSEDGDNDPSPSIDIIIEEKSSDVSGNNQ